MNKILNTTILTLGLLLSTLQAANPISQAKAGGRGNNPVSQKYLNQGSSNNPVSTDEAVPPVPITYQVGDYAQGGVVCYVDETGQHGLVCSLIYLDANGSEDTGLNGVAWGQTGEATNATSPLGDVNMQIIRNLGIDNYPAFKACQSYRAGAFSDWFLPSQNTAHNGTGYNELNYIYENSGLAGPVSEGISINEALTNLQNQGETVQLLSSSGGPFNNGATWSSFEKDNELAWYQNFSSGSQNSNVSKGVTLLVRADRAF
jgi:hypothetical protein